MINEKKFLEYAVYNKFFYGTSLKWVLETLKKTNVICEIDVQGFLNIKKKYGNILPILSFFILPPNENELKKRIIDRNSNDIQHIEDRINISRWEIKNKNKYDYIIINNNINITTKKIYEILKKNINLFSNFLGIFHQNYQLLLNNFRLLIYLLPA